MTDVPVMIRPLLERAEQCARDGSWPVLPQRVDALAQAVFALAGVEPVPVRFDPLGCDGGASLTWEGEGFEPVLVVEGWFLLALEEAKDQTLLKGERLKAVIAHEVGHLRQGPGFASPRREADADLYARSLGFGQQLAAALSVLEELTDGIEVEPSFAERISWSLGTVRPDLAQLEDVQEIDLEAIQREIDEARLQQPGDWWS